MAYRSTEISHTADVGLAISADSYAELLSGAAEAMFAIAAPTAPAGTRSPAELRILEVDEQSPDLLLRAWLSELLYFFATDHWVLSGIRTLSIHERGLRAEVEGTRLTRAQARQATEIKAVTYHGLSVRQTADGWEATVIFDM